MWVGRVVSSIALLACVGVRVTVAGDVGLRGGDAVLLSDTVVGGGVKPIHCQMKPWGPWSPCGTDGYKQRHRVIDIDRNELGRACPFDTERIKCRKQDCVVCDWKEDECDKEHGTKRFWREIIRQPELDGEPCPTELERVEKCDVDCEVYKGEFDITPDCDENGDKWQYPRIKFHAKNNGAECPGPTKIPEVCPPEHCKYKTKDEDTTTPFDQCTLDSSDNRYYKKRTLAIATPARYRGNACKPEDGLDKRDCAVDCEVYDNEFDETPCDVNGDTQKTPKVKVQPQYNGRACPGPQTVVQKCPPENCKFKNKDEDTSTPFGTCTLDTSDNRYYKTRLLAITTPARYRGTCKDEDRTDKRDCAVNCEVYENEFDETPCDANGDTVKTPKVKVQPQYNGRACPPPQNHVGACPPENCKFKNKDEDTSTPFGTCTLDTSDNRYYKTRLLAITTPARYRGTCKDEDRTDKRDCAVDCVVYDNQFDETPCDVNGDTVKTPKVQVQPQYNGRACPPPQNHVGACPPENCKFKNKDDDKTTPFGTCTLDARDKKYYKTRLLAITTPARYRGTCKDEDRTDKVECSRDCYNRQNNVDFLCSLYDLSAKKLGNENACCNFCKTTAACKAYSYRSDIKACVIMAGRPDIFKAKNGYYSGYVGWV